MNELDFSNLIPCASPPFSRLGKKLESSCRKALYDHSMLEGAQKIGVALSGGKDSLTLLFLLKAILGRGFPDLPLLAFHIDGEFSCGASIPKSYLQAICKKIEIPLFFATSSITKDKLACYRCSRERRTLLFEMAKKEGCHHIAFGHHRDDSVQTMLMNLLQKGEFAGMLPKVPMIEYDVTIIRPLIYITEKEIIQFAQKYGFARVTCQCPVGARSKRQEVKHLMQQFNKIFPNAEENLAHATFNYGSQKALIPSKKTPSKGTSSNESQPSIPTP